MAGLCGLFLLAAVAWSPAVQAQPPVFLVRHADRQDWSEDSALSPAGEERARRLAALLKDAGVTAVYATEFQRTQKTAEPLARLLGIRPVILPHTEYQDLVRRIEDRKEVAVVVGHDSTIPSVLRLLGHPEPITIAPTEYDNLFIVLPRENSRPRVIRLRY